MTIVGGGFPFTMDDLLAELNDKFGPNPFEHPSAEEELEIMGAEAEASLQLMANNCRWVQLQLYSEVLKFACMGMIHNVANEVVKARMFRLPPGAHRNKMIERQEQEYLVAEKNNTLMNEVRHSASVHRVTESVHGITSDRFRLFSKKATPFMAGWSAEFICDERKRIEEKADVYYKKHISGGENSPDDSDTAKVDERYRMDAQLECEALAVVGYDYKLDRP